MKTLVWLIVIVVLVVAAFGILQWVRRQIASSREDLKHVDRSKLRDLDDDAWAEEERDKDDWKR
ncbi:hypothetical protein SAOR_14140 [Salinisphaera orenii MK-B5]|uniref:Uncharacterized protein n=1 Tax=Salinisphaera orenii MK-B5 TaxID=856730 RepID=A0A423PGG8_9GAMM|nr:MULTISPECIES: hypothetical protein [Salinisphaera]ROO24749.1 hypothetical protein SAOR_14140 [Salinisphaera orenii MK-B5]